MFAGRGVSPVLDVAEEVLGAEEGEGRDGGRGRGGAGHQGEAIGGAGHGAASAGHRGQEQQQGRGGGAVHGGGMWPGGGPGGISATHEAVSRVTDSQPPAPGCSHYCTLQTLIDGQYTIIHHTAQEGT